jgi:hypothetical protein
MGDIPDTIDERLYEQKGIEFGNRLPIISVRDMIDIITSGEVSKLLLEYVYAAIISRSSKLDTARLPLLRQFEERALERYRQQFYRPVSHAYGVRIERSLCDSLYPSIGPIPDFVFSLIPGAETSDFFLEYKDPRFNPEETKYVRAYITLDISWLLAAISASTATEEMLAIMSTSSIRFFISVCERLQKNGTPCWAKLASMTGILGRTDNIVLYIDSEFADRARADLRDLVGTANRTRESKGETVVVASPEADIPGLAWGVEPAKRDEQIIECYSSDTRIQSHSSVAAMYALLSYLPRCIDEYKKQGRDSSIFERELQKLQGCMNRS